MCRDMKQPSSSSELIPILSMLLLVVASVIIMSVSMIIGWWSAVDGFCNDSCCGGEG